MKSSIPYLTIDQLDLDNAFLQVNEWNRVGKALAIVDTDLISYSFDSLVGSHSINKFYEKDCYVPIEVAGPAFCSDYINKLDLIFQASYDHLEIQLREFLQKMEQASIQNLETRKVLSQINRELKKYNASGDEKHLIWAAQVLLQFKKVQSERLYYNRRKLRYLVISLLGLQSRDKRQVFRRIIRFLFKNLDADKNDIEVLFKNDVQQNFFIKIIHWLYEYTRNNRIFKFFDRNRFNTEHTNKGRAGRNHRKVKESPFPGRTVSTYFSTRLAFRNQFN